MKCVSEDNLKQYDTKLKEYISLTKELLLDLFTYGIKWTYNLYGANNPEKTGNLNLHETLPIQNGMKGCIAQMKDGPKIMYYLNDDDWRFTKKYHYSFKEKISRVEAQKYSMSNDIFKTRKYDKQYIKLSRHDDYKNAYVAQIISIDTETGKIVFYIDEISPNTYLNEDDEYFIWLGSVLNGYDGEVMVEVPEFWIKSWEHEDGSQEVRISTVRIDETWQHSPHCLIGAYKDTILNKVPLDFGYLSELPEGSAICVLNTNDYCRGGNGSSDYDLYLETDPYRTHLGKCITNISRPNMRIAERKSGKEIINYILYKNIIYWLFAIENCRLSAYTATVSIFKGLKLSDWLLYNNECSVIPCGYMNKYGNKSIVSSLDLTLPDGCSESSYTVFVLKYRGIEQIYNDVLCNLDGILIEYANEMVYGATHDVVYITDNPQLYNDTDISKFTGEKKYILSGGAPITYIYVNNTADVLRSYTISYPFPGFGMKYSPTGENKLEKGTLTTCLMGGNISLPYYQNEILTMYVSVKPQNSTNFIGYRSICIID